MMPVSVKQCNEMKLAGLMMPMSLLANRTQMLWRQFMQRRRELGSVVSEKLISLQQYEPEYFTDFNPGRMFKKWALQEVANLELLPEGMQSFVLEAGLYAVFQYKGMPGNAEVFRYIFLEWLPASAYILDQRPHFEVMGAGYRNDDPHSEEEIWIPIR
jgi:AraC family transcriptional regulator